MPLNITPQYALKTAALLGLMGWAMPSWATFICDISNSPEVEFTTINPLDGGAAPTQTWNISYSCRRTVGVGNRARLCFSIGDGTSGAGSNFNPRYLKSPQNNILNFQIYKDSGSDVWGSQGNATTFTHYVTNQANGISFPYTGSKEVFFKITETNLQIAKPGTYTSQFNGGHTRLKAALRTSPLNIDSDCDDLQEGTDNQRFPFSVKAIVNAQCKITSINDINFGSHLGGQSSNLAQSTDLKVQCTNTTPYNIALTPSNSNTTGAGLMKKAGDPSQTVPYQLRKATGMSGAVWGNAGVSASNQGNGVGGTGSGYEVTHKIYATVANTNYAPGDYEDTVTVTVHY